MNLRIREIASWSVVAIAVAGLVVFGYTSDAYRRAHAIRADGCFAFQPTPVIAVFASDVTDPLEGDQPRRWRATVDARIGALAPGAKLLFTTISAIAPTEVQFDAGPCKPPKGGDLRLRKMREAMTQAVDRAEAKVRAAHPQQHSAISATILRIAADPAFAGKSAISRVITVESDLLEADAVSAYRRTGFTLPTPIGRPLDGITLNLVVLRNTRDARFQTPALIKVWIAWAQAAGADVTVDCPWLGYPPQTAYAGGQ